MFCHCYNNPDVGLSSITVPLVTVISSNLITITSKTVRSRIETAENQLEPNSEDLPNATTGAICKINGGCNFALA
jgi:hypothetical protein